MTTKIRSGQIDTGVGPGSVVQLDASSRLPAVDGSLLTNLPSAGIANVVEDTTPQLGGALDLNGQSIITANAAVGNALVIAAGDGTAGSGGAMDITAGDGTTSGGTINITAGTGGQSGGAINITAGTGGGFGGGSVRIYSGDEPGNSNGGDILLLLADGAGGGGNNGDVIITSSAVSASLRPKLLLKEATSNGINHVGLVAPASITTDAVWTIPEAQNTSEDPLGIDLGEYTIAALPAAGTYPNCWALAVDAVGGRTIVRSDGTNWKIVVVEGATVA